LARDASSVAASWRHTSTLSVVGGPASLRVDSAGADHSCSSNLSHPPFLTESLHGSTVSSASTGDGEQCSSVAGFCTVRGGACANFVSASSTSAGGGEATLQGSAEREENRGRDACKLCERGGKQLTCTAALVHCEGPTARLLAHSTAAQAHTVGLACANSRRAGRAYLPTWAVNDADQQQLFERHLLMNPKSRRSHRTREQPVSTTPLLFEVSSPRQCMQCTQISKSPTNAGNASFYRRAKHVPQQCGRRRSRMPSHTCLCRSAARWVRGVSKRVWPTEEWCSRAAWGTLHK
jgi:hypothetical protein